VGVALGIIALVGFFQLRRISKGRRQELALNIDPDEWIVEQDELQPTDAWLTIREDRHQRGADVGVRVEQVALKHWDLAEPEIVNGNITIRYAHNNFPLNPRIPIARVHLQSRLIVHGMHPHSVVELWFANADFPKKTVGANVVTRAALLALWLRHGIR
jgi:hypothetical protein